MFLPSGFAGPTSIKLASGTVVPSWRKMVVSIHQVPCQANGSKMAYQVNPNISPARNLKIHLSSAISLSYSLFGKSQYKIRGNDQNQLDDSMYKLEQIVYLCICSQNIWTDFLTDEVSQLLLAAYSKLCQESNDLNTRRESGCQVTYTGLTGRPALAIPRETLKLYFKVGFLTSKDCRYFRHFTENYK